MSRVIGAILLFKEAVIDITHNPKPVSGALRLSTLIAARPGDAHAEHAFSCKLVPRGTGQSSGPVREPLPLATPGNRQACRSKAQLGKDPTEHGQDSEDVPEERCKRKDKLS